MRWDITTLKFMYNMERFATQIYLTQRRTFSEKVIVDRLTAAAANEQEHVDILGKRINELGGRRSYLGFLFQMAGRKLAIAAGLFGKILVLNTDIRVEKRAIKDYTAFLNRVKYDKETAAMIEKIISDEVGHVNTWETSLKEVRDTK